MTIELQEMKLRILAEFDDRNSADVFDVFWATLPSSEGAASELALYSAALLALVSTGVITLGLGVYGLAADRQLDQQASLDLVAELPGWFKFDPAKRTWTLAKGQIGKDAVPIVILTDLGKARALDVRINHGFRWWRKRSEAGP